MTDLSPSHAPVILSAPRPSALPAGLRVYAIGDIHGRADLLVQMLHLIEADRQGFHGDIKVIFLGDYIDRGHLSQQVLETLIHLAKTNSAVEFIRGNHEDVMVRLFRDHSVVPGWFHYGGLQTLRSYGIDVPNATQDFDDMFRLRRQLEQKMPDEHKYFVNGLQHMLRYGDYVFTHAGVHPGRALDKQDTHHLMWIREPFLSSDKDLGFTVVHGHSIRLKPEIQTSRIGIDTGAYATGRLTCLVLEGDTRRFLST